MAELVGLIASIGSIAGAAAKVSLALFECGRDIASARTELDSLASEVSDLSSALEYLIDVVRKHESQIIAQTIKTINNLVMRCEKVLEELKITAELVKSRAARFKWLFRKPKILEQKTNLQAFRSNLSLVIQTLILAKSLEHEPKKFVGFSNLFTQCSNSEQRAIAGRTQCLFHDSTQYKFTAEFCRK